MAIPTLALLKAQREQLLTLAEGHGVRALRVFGSVARGEAREGSDLDLLGELAPGRNLLDQMAFEEALEGVLGCRVEVVNPRQLNPRIAQQVLREAFPL